MRQDKKKDTTVSEGMATAGRAVKTQPQSVKQVQEFAKQEMERKRKEEEEKKKKKTQVVSEPKGLLQRLYDYATGSK